MHFLAYPQIFSKTSIIPFKLPLDIFWLPKGIKTRDYVINFVQQS